MKKHLLAVALSFATVSAAQAASVLTEGEVVNQCTFTSVTPGEFGSNVIAPNRLSTSHVGGTGGEVVFTYTGQPTLAITGPSAFGTSPDLGSIVAEFTTIASSTAKGSLSFTGASTSTQYTTGSSDTIALGLQVYSGGETNFPAGTYGASTVLSCS